jgi:hypothetical protein
MYARGGMCCLHFQTTLKMEAAFLRNFGKHNETSRFRVDPEDRSSTFLRNVGKHLPNYTASHYCVLNALSVQMAGMNWTDSIFIILHRLSCVSVKLTYELCSGSSLNSSVITLFQDLQLSYTYPLQNSFREQQPTASMAFYTFGSTVGRMFGREKSDCGTYNQ